MIKQFSIAVLLFAGAAFAQYGSDSGLVYEERSSLGLFYEHAGALENIQYEYKVWNQPYSLQVEEGPVFGLGGHLPINRWVGLHGFAALQKLKFDYALLGDSSLRASMLNEELEDDLPRNLTALDLQGTLNSHNLFAQVGLEAGIPVYSNYQNQFLLRLLGFGNGIIGKTIFGETKFTNAAIWGYGYGAGARIAWGPISIEGGMKWSHVYWRTFFEPEDQTVLNDANGDTFMLDYDTALSPYFKICWGLI